MYKHSRFMGALFPSHTKANKFSAYVFVPLDFKPRVGDLCSELHGDNTDLIPRDNRCLLSA